MSMAPKWNFRGTTKVCGITYRLVRATARAPSYPLDINLSGTERVQLDTMPFFDAGRNRCNKH